MENLTLKDLTREKIIILVKSLMTIIYQSAKPIIWVDHLFEVVSIFQLYRYDYNSRNIYCSFSEFCELCSLPKHKFYEFTKGKLTKNTEWQELKCTFNLELNDKDLTSIIFFINKQIVPILYPLEIKIQVMLTEDEMRIFNLLRVDNSMKFSVTYLNYHFKDLNIEMVLESLLIKRLITRFSSDESLDNFYQSIVI